jgi:hypothetical protein
MNLLSKNILQDISNEIKQYNLSNKDKTPSYIIINEADSIRLLIEMHKAKMIPDVKEPKKLQIQGLRVLRTMDIPVGYFDVTGG